MNKRSLLLEIGLEEMPARYMNESAGQLKDKVAAWLEDHKIPFGKIRTYVTPRRLAVLAEDVAEAQEDTVEEAKGPAKKIALDEDGNWTKAAAGFTRGQGMTTDDIFFKELNGVEYAHVKKFSEGKAALELLPELSSVITSMHFPKSMRWGNSDLRYIRPIKWIVALFGSEVIPFAAAGVQTGSTTYGHRFLGEEVTLLAPEDYEKVLLGQYVIADYGERREAVLDQIGKLAEENNWEIPVDDELLEEVTNLVEYPTVFAGSFNESFLQLPDEVLITSMKTHQRYFPVIGENGKLLAHFVGVRNGDHRHLEKVVKGNEKVLRARLADGEFFFEEDRKMEIADALKKLETIVYHEKMGTLAQKVERIRKISGLIAGRLSLPDEEKEWIDRTAAIAKFDLVTNMVNEFPELQGIIGEKYALEKGEHEDVAKAINEHYQPRHADDSIPASRIGAVVAAADKLDTILSAFSIGMIPTGSQDPYALRRQAAGIIQIFNEKQWHIPFAELLAEAADIVAADIEKTNDNLAGDLIQFFKLRMKHMLQAGSVSHDIIEAVLAAEITDLPAVFEKARVIMEHRKDAGFKEVVESLSRVMNIAGKADRDSAIDPERFENEQERDLYAHYSELKKTVAAHKDAESEYRELAALAAPIAAYFDNNMVMAEDEKVKENRLAQMRELAVLIGSFADMNEILVK